MPASRKGVQVKNRLAAALIGAAALTLLFSGIASAAPAERLEAVCIASMYDGESTLRITVWTPEYPEYWDTGPPIGAFALAPGTAVFTSSGRVNVTCQGPTAEFNPTPGWPSEAFSGSVVCDTARGGEGSLGVGARVYIGKGTVKTSDGRVKVTCNGAYSHTVGEAV